MASEAEIHLVRALVEILNEKRPVGAPAEVLRKGKGGADDKMMPLSIIRESDTDPRHRPCLVIIADAGELSHPRLYSFEIRVENLYQVDDFTEDEVSGWQSAVACYLNDYQEVFADTFQKLKDHGSPWRVRQIKPSAGGSEVDGQRSRGLVDRWRVSMIK